VAEALGVEAKIVHILLMPLGAFDTSRARRELGYVPAVSLNDGLKRAAAWYRDEGLIG
jgi:nucleoside-diphosphate-sugar epimerase